VGEANCFALGSKVEVEHLVFATGGGATNAAVTFARQGLKTAAFFKVGDDSIGREIASELKKEGVRPMALWDEKHETAYSTILLSADGERTILVYRGASEDIKAKEIPWKSFKAKWVYIAPGGIDFDLVNTLVDGLMVQGIDIAINPSAKKFIGKGLRGMANILSKAKVVILNREEAALLTGISYQEEKRIFRALDEAVPGIAVMTDGQEE